MSDPTSTPEAPAAEPSVLAGAVAPEAPATPEAEAPKSPGEVLYPEQVKEDVKAAEVAAAEDAPAAKPEEPKAEAKPTDAAGYKIEVPADLKIDDKAISSFKEFAAKSGLTNETAQSMFDLHVEQVKATAEALSSEVAKQWKTTMDGWKTEVDNDKDLGGANREAALATLGRAFDDYGSKEAREAFDLTGAGNNPAIIRMMHKMARALTEGGPVNAGRPTSSRGLTLGERLYPTQ